MDDHASLVAKARTNDTLGDILRRAAYAQLPGRFYGVLQLCAPLSVQLWLTGSHRIAGWLFAASAFGAWALAQQHINGYADEFPPLAEQDVPVSRGWRVLRGASAAIGSAAALALLGDAFIRLMATLFHCPGCAG